MGGASEGKKGEVVKERAHLVMISGVWGGVAREWTPVGSRDVLLNLTRSSLLHLWCKGWQWKGCRCVAESVIAFVEPSNHNLKYVGVAFVNLLIEMKQNQGWTWGNLSGIAYTVVKFCCGLYKKVTKILVLDRYSIITCSELIFCNAIVQWKMDDTIRSWYLIKTS